MANFVLTSWREILFLATRPWLLFRPGLSLSDMAKEPFSQFDQWFSKARKHFLTTGFPNSMTLSTLGPDAYPEGRMVLLKSYDKSGFVFYTNARSRKGKSIKDHEKGGLTFYWGALLRQIRVIGQLAKVSDEESDMYFSSRPRMSQIGAWASNQSEVLDSRKTLEDRVKDYSEKFSNQAVPRPPYWCGYRLTPIEFEFWQLRRNRLHDRFRYRLQDDGSWVISRLNP